MPGPAPKDHTIRAGKHGPKSTRTTLSADSEPEFDVPELPDMDDREWHSLTLQFWEDTWSSPMASEYLLADIHGLFRLAVLIDDFWKKPTGALSAEIRLMQQPYGLTPLDRRRLEWSVEQSEDAKDRGAERRKRAQREQVPSNGPDPRSVFSA